jgi:hypothetical protein
MNNDYEPDDHCAIVDASMQKNLAGQTGHAGFAAEDEDYWKSTTHCRTLESYKDASGVTRRQEGGFYEDKHNVL